MGKKTLTAHIVPEGEDPEHRASINCACNPSVTPVIKGDDAIGTLVTHHPWNGRTEQIS